MRLRFWLKSGLSNVLVCVVASVIYTFLQASTTSNSENIPILCVVYLIFMGALFSLIYASSSSRAQLSLVLSFGSTRREAYVGLQIFRAIPFVCITALGALICAFTDMPEGISPFSVILLCGFTFPLANALGLLAMLAKERFGNVAMGLTVAFSVLFFSGAILVFVLHTIGIITFNALPILLPTSIGLYVVATVWEHKSLTRLVGKL